jgi:pimeloyl-ACP methyl ester carboxylesterase
MTGRHRGGSGEPLVLIHGFSHTWRVWEPVIPPLERDHDVLASTLTGHVGGPRFPEGTSASIAGLADGVERELDELGWSRAHFAGNSLGGLVTLELATRGRALSATAISPGGGWEAGSKEEQRIERFFRRAHRSLAIGGRHAERLVSRPRLRALVLRDLAAHPQRIPPAAAADIMRGMAEMEDYVPFLESLKEIGPPQDFDGIDCPVRIAWGTKDRVLPIGRYSERLRRLIPEAEFVELPGLGHTPTYDDPALVARTITEVTSRARATQAVPEPA